MRKFTKEEVSYEHPAKGPDHCSLCKHFIRKKHTELSGCEIVSGLIRPEDWCDEFKAKHVR